MKTLTLTQPWATLVAIGAKRIETRSWSTSYRGPIAIHAAKGFPKWARDFTLDPLVLEAMRIYNKHSGYPLGAVIATAQLIGILPTELLIGGTVFDVSFEGISEREKAFGDFSPGRFGWILEDVKQLPNPDPCRGALGLWEWDANRYWEMRKVNALGGGCK